MSTWLLACKELNGGVYVTRLPRAIHNPDGSVQPGVPDNWFFVGPGTSPSVEAYSAVSVNITATSVTANTLTVTCNNSFLVGETVTLNGTAEGFLNGQVVTIATATSTSFTAAFTHGNYSNPADSGTASFNQFILIFDFLSRLIVRVLDINVWPPNEIIPIATSSPFAITSDSGAAAGLLNDNLIFEVPNSNMATVFVRNQFDPPYLAHNIIFFNVTTNTYSVLLQPDPTWITNLPNTTNFFRLYRSPLGPNPTWTLIEDWNTTFASSGFTDSNVGILQFQYSATIGAFFNPRNPSNPNDHEESMMGPSLAFDSTQGHLGFLIAPSDVMDLNAGQYATGFMTGDATASFSSTQRFLVLVLPTPPSLGDFIDYPGLQVPVTGQPTTPLQEGPTSATCSVGGRAGFVALGSITSDTIGFGQLVTPVVGQPPTELPGGNAACTVYG
jgi:hypothetical protein